jgi:ligand-binding sensor domain-containing protein
MRSGAKTKYAGLSLVAAGAVIILLPYVSGHGTKGYAVAAGASPAVEVDVAQVVAKDSTLFVYEHSRFSPVEGTHLEKADAIAAIVADPSGKIWAMSKNGVLLGVESRKVVDRFVDATFDGGPALTADPRNGIWLNTENQDLIHVHDGKLTRFELHRPVEGSIYALITTSNGTVLAATDSGVTGLRDGRIQSLGVKNGLPCGHVWSLVAAENSAVWLYTDCGLIETRPMGALVARRRDPSNVQADGRAGRCTGTKSCIRAGGY